MTVTAAPAVSTTLSRDEILKARAERRVAKRDRRIEALERDLARAENDLWRKERKLKRAIEMLESFQELTEKHGPIDRLKSNKTGFGLWGLTESPAQSISNFDKLNP